MTDYKEVKQQKVNELSCNSCYYADKSDVLEKIEQTVVDFFTQVMQMDSFTLRLEGLE